MKKIKKNYSLSLAFSIIFVILGLFLFIKPDITITTISYIASFILLVLGITSIFRYFKYDFEISAFDFDLVYGVLIIIAGIYLIINPLILLKIFNIVLGIWIIINSVVKFQYALVLRKIKSIDFKYVLILSIISFILGIILLINPLKTILLITQVVGIFIILYGMLDIINNFILKRNEEYFNRLLSGGKDEKE